MTNLQKAIVLLVMLLHDQTYMLARYVLS